VPATVALSLFLCVVTTVDCAIPRLAIQVDNRPKINRLSADDGRSIGPDEKGAIVVRKSK
jgi:hypothetical protein